MALELTISTRAIFDQIANMLNLDSSLRDVAIRSWCSEALDFIGVGSQYILREKELDIHNFKAPIPCGYQTYKFIYAGRKCDNIGQTSGMIWSNELRIHPTESPTMFDKGNPHVTSNSTGNYREFNISGGNINVGFRTGHVFLIYDSLQVDDEGYPMMPDDVSFAYALFWFCIRNLIFGGYKLADPSLNFMYCDTQWHYYCGQARAMWQFPNVAQMEAIASNWQRLIPQRKRFDDGFKNLNKREEGRINM
jgi:hypothetical protein